MNEKLTFYRSAERMYPNDWRTSNNVGCILLQQNKLQDAKAQFDKAAKVSANNPIIMNNQAICIRWMGDRKGAKEMLMKAGAAGPEVNYNLGIIAVQDGKYADAVSNFGGSKDFNTALAQVLNGDLDGALRTLDASAEKESAMAYYLRAIVGARKGDANMVTTNLSTACSKDASLKAKAAQDAEFQKFKDNSEFKSITQ
jgi:tetratricopeptide (TPR) repeat protein